MSVPMVAAAGLSVIVAAASLPEIIASVVLIAAAVVAILDRVGWVSLDPAVKRLRREAEDLDKEAKRLTARVETLEAQLQVLKAENERLARATDLSALDGKLDEMSQLLRANTAAVEHLARQVIVEGAHPGGDGGDRG